MTYILYLGRKSTAQYRWNQKVWSIFFYKTDGKLSDKSPTHYLVHDKQTGVRPRTRFIGWLLILAGTWRVSLEPVEAGGPYTVTAASHDNTVTLTDVLFGDIWLCGGQSNMHFPVSRVCQKKKHFWIVKTGAVFMEMGCKMLFIYI